MIAWAMSRIRSGASVVRDFWSGLVTGLVVIWMVPRMLHGMGAILLIGLLTALVH